MNCRGLWTAALLGLSTLWGAGCGEEYEAYIAQLRSGSVRERQDAAAFLGGKRILKAAPALRMALRDSVADVRIKAAWALGMIRSRGAMHGLLMLLGDRNRRSRQTAIWALTQIEEPEALPGLRAALSVERDTWIRSDLERAVEYLEQFRGEADLNEAIFK